MKIESYDISMQSSSSFVYKEQSSMKTSLSSNSFEKLHDNSNTNSVNVKTPANLKAIFNVEENLSNVDRIKKQIIELLLSRLSKHNEKINLHPSNNHGQHTSDNSNNPYANLQKGSSWGFLYESSQEYYQKSTVEFSTQATIKTSNGEFNIDINMSYTQEFYEKHQMSLKAAGANFEDPLLLNYDAQIGSFDMISKNMSFEFDINGDGQNESIPELTPGSGFLALDKNNNGEVDDGNELFGPTTGDGFEELRAYDEDGNNWIDENDSIFNDLRVWEKDENGNSSLITLGQAGVGAIYLSAINTDFKYANGIGDDTAQLNETSFFLKEDGGAGLVTSVDFAI